MRKDWDYVDFKDYASDMDELTRAAADAVDHAQREKQRTFQLLIAAAISSDKPLVIHRGSLLRVEDYDWTIDRYYCDDTIRISVKPKVK